MFEKAITVAFVACLGTAAFSSWGAGFERTLIGHNAARIEPANRSGVMLGNVMQAGVATFVVRSAKVLEDARDVANHGYSSVITEAAASGRKLPTPSSGTNVIPLPAFEHGGEMIRGVTLEIDTQGRVALQREGNGRLGSFTNSPQLAKSLAGHFGANADGRTVFGSRPGIHTQFETTAESGSKVRTSFIAVQSGTKPTFSEERFVWNARTQRAELQHQRSYDKGGAFLVGRFYGSALSDVNAWLTDEGIYRPASRTSPARFSMKLDDMPTALRAKGADAEWLAWLLETRDSFGALELTAMVDGKSISMPANRPSFALLDALADEGNPARLSLTEDGLRATHISNSYEPKEMTLLTAKHDGSFIARVEAVKDGKRIESSEVHYDQRGRWTYARFEGTPDTLRKIGPFGLKLSDQDGHLSPRVHVHHGLNAVPTVAVQVVDLPTQTAWQRFWQPSEPVDTLKWTLREAQQVEMTPDSLVVVDRRGRRIEYATKSEI